MHWPPQWARETTCMILSPLIALHVSWCSCRPLSTPVPVNLISPPPPFTQSRKYIQDVLFPQARDAKQSFISLSEAKGSKDPTYYFHIHFFSQQTILTLKIQVGKIMEDIWLGYNRRNECTGPVLVRINISGPWCGILWNTELYLYSHSLGSSYTGVWWRPVLMVALRAVS